MSFFLNGHGDDDNGYYSCYVITNYLCIVALLLLNGLD